MKKLKILPVFLLFIIPFISNAQKLPTVQQTAMRAPANVVIDGLATEWGANLQAYNKSTELYYTIANDDDNLYLTVQATNPRVIQKLLMAGLTLSVNSSGKKDNVNAVAVTFPLLSFVNSRHLLIDARLIPDVLRDRHAPEALPADSLTGFINKNLLINAKEVKVLNLNAVTDTITGVMTDKRAYFRNFTGFHDPGRYIPVDNKDGIKVRASFDDKKVLTYELAIPLKYFGLTKGAQQKLAYNIKLNGLLDKNGNPPAGGSVDEVRDSSGIIRDPNQDLDFPTDFWGEYPLAK